ncbi:MAG TPA: ATP-binding cassette domain-containing protein, partial [Clostridiaceae bacterium]|nr:ATP-binding cassette domain-containing protein [Clostridiaceae bacterium]
GPTGSGKSTLVNLIPGFYDVTEGKISIDGIDIKDIDIEELRESIGMVLQESILFTGTIKDNISWGREDASEEDIIEAAKAAQAHNFITQFPDGYDTILGQRGVNLSGGQKQRISIARALLKKPEILILDDSTSAVDMETEARIQAALKELIENSTCFIIAQRISSVMDADKIIVLEDGNIVNMGTHLELLKSCRIYRGIYDSQLGGRMVSYGS